MKYLFIGLVFFLVATSCTDDNMIVELCNDYQIVLNDTVYFESTTKPTVYSLDLDSDGIEDATIRLNLYAGTGGYACSISCKVNDDNWSIAAQEVLVYICQDTMQWESDPNVVYYENYACKNQENTIRVDTLQIVDFFQEPQLDIIENKLQEAFLYKYNGVGSDGFFPGASFNDITTSVFENSIDSGWIVFERSDSDLYGIEVAIDDSALQIPSIYVRQIKSLDCE